MSAFNDGIEARKLREKLGQNQTTFWRRVTVQQSAASRYETGREIPEAVQILLMMAYGTDKQAASALAASRPPLRYMQPGKPDLMVRRHLLLRRLFACGVSRASILVTSYDKGVAA